jgi:hypothetical protein
MGYGPQIGGPQDDLAGFFDVMRAVLFPRLEAVHANGETAVRGLQHLLLA